MSTDKTTFDTGMDLRRDMFGAAGADDAFAAASDFSKPLQEVVTAFCFGDIWQRPGLDRKTRSMLTVAMLIANGRSVQLPTHIRGAIENGVTEDEIREIAMHAVLYCGIPAAFEATAIAEKTLRS